ncbi:hypothetical protein C487_06138 [Natrinema pallidum DSM 3751]|uniref:Uncharacterized protein n=1 Tax=Natrinema pallidum DSM 3751 TaxID=1227495 RepID=L9Z001_9EURY|nr:hypothetical protein C487_06138 [Natrinema pallidum DSM 3751]
MRAFAFQRFMPPALSRATPRRAFSATVALDTDPHIGPDTSGHIPLAARSGRVGARCWMIVRLGRALARAHRALAKARARARRWFCRSLSSRKSAML